MILDLGHLRPEQPKRHKRKNPHGNARREGYKERKGRKMCPNDKGMEQVLGVEPRSSAWKAEVIAVIRHLQVGLRLSALHSVG